MISRVWWWCVHPARERLHLLMKGNSLAGHLSISCRWRHQPLADGGWRDDDSMLNCSLIVPHSTSWAITMLFPQERLYYYSAFLISVTFVTFRKTAFIHFHFCVSISSLVSQIVWLNSHSAVCFPLLYWSIPPCFRYKHYFICWVGLGGKSAAL